MLVGEQNRQPSGNFSFIANNVDLVALGFRLCATIRRILIDVFLSVAAP